MSELSRFVLLLEDYRKYVRDTDTPTEIYERIMSAAINAIQPAPSNIPLSPVGLTMDKLLDWQNKQSRRF